MRFSIEKIESSQRESKGCPKKLSSETVCDSSRVFRFSEEHFTRVLKDDYEIVLFEGGQAFLVARLNYYEIAEMHGDVFFNDSFWLHLLNRINTIVSGFDTVGNKIDYYEVVLNEFIALTIPVFERIQKEFNETEEGKVFSKHRETLEKFWENISDEHKESLLKQLYQTLEE